jgi:hypothetical protein
MTNRRTFDLDETERLRRALLLYKDSQGIGTPQLAIRVKAANPLASHVNHRRIARFLAKQNATIKPEDMFVGWIENFLRTVPAAPDASWELAKGLMSFYGVEETNGFAGDYTLFTHGEDVMPEATLSVTQDAGFCRVNQKTIGGNNFYDGVLVATAGTKIFALKNRMTSLPRLYKITRMAGLALHTSDNGIVDTFPIRLARL